MKDKCLCVLAFLKKYGGKQYRKLEKCSSEEERQYMVEGQEAGRYAREAFGCLVDIIEKKYGLEHDKITQWQNSGTFVSYFWCQMKKSSRKKSQISLSLFAEKADETFRFRISVELATDKASADDLSRYAKLLDKPLEPTLVYVSGGNNENEFRVLDERNHDVVKAMRLKKVQVSEIIDENQLSVNNLQVIENAVERLVVYYDALFEQSVVKKDAVEISGGEKELNVISAINIYISAQGFYYPDGFIKNFYLSLKSKPFVILAGISGTGKTRLVRLFAEAIGAEYKQVAVRPDWSDSSDLFGYINLKGNFVKGQILDFIKKAKDNLEKPYILCLDEMNLARVEYYLSDFLSVIETRDRKGEEIITDSIISKELFGNADGWDDYKDLYIPENLYVIGTVNMDETTFPFSKKVLDRANTIEFSTVNLKPKNEIFLDVEPLNLNNDFLKSNYLLLNDCPNDKVTNDTIDVLVNINKSLEDINAQIAYRTRDEIVFYMQNNKNVGLLSFAEALDNEILQKILPRIQGSSLDVKDALCGLAELTVKDTKSIKKDTIVEDLNSCIEGNKCKYPKSAKKIASMIRRYNKDGFTTFWI